MTVEGAGKIAHFIDRAHACTKALSLLTHCEAGVSRSAAIALFAEALTGATLRRHEQACLANRHVLAVLCRLRRPLYVDVPPAPALDSAFKLLFR
jgi:predicted protein tyrosine phosphatase